MKKIIFSLILIIFMLTGQIVYLYNNNNYKMLVNFVRVVDGDTIKVSIYDNEFPVRLVGVDCYETSKIPRAYKQADENNITIDEVVQRGLNSKTFLENLKSDKKVYLDFKGLDKYKRVLGVIYFDNQNVNQELVKNGGCMVYHYKK